MTEATEAAGPVDIVQAMEPAEASKVATAVDTEDEAEAKPEPPLRSPTPPPAPVTMPAFERMPIPEQLREADFPPLGSIPPAREVSEPGGDSCAPPPPADVAAPAADDGAIDLEAEGAIYCSHFGGAFSDRAAESRRRVDAHIRE